MERRKINVERTSLRRELEQYVTSFNICLRNVVQSMNIIILLRNAHPIYRRDFAHKLQDEGLITQDQLKEFIKPT